MAKKKTIEFLKNAPPAKETDVSLGFAEEAKASLVGNVVSFITTELKDPEPNTFTQQKLNETIQSSIHNLRVVLSWVAEKKMKQPANAETARQLIGSAIEEIENIRPASLSGPEAIKSAYEPVRPRYARHSLPAGSPFLRKRLGRISLIASRSPALTS